MFSDMKTKPACPALTDTAALLAFLWALQKAQVCPSRALQAGTAVPSEEQPVQESSAGPLKAAATAPSRGESPRELPDALGVVTLTSPPVALSSPL